MEQTPEQNGTVSKERELLRVVIQRWGDAFKNSSTAIPAEAVVGMLENLEKEQSDSNVTPLNRAVEALQTLAGFAANIEKNIREEAEKTGQTINL